MMIILGLNIKMIETGVLTVAVKTRTVVTLPAILLSKKQVHENRSQKMI
jgi:hypothetical protein